MKKLIPLVLVMAVTLLPWSFFAPGNAQDIAREEKPTFYRLTPGVYVNGWPRFTIHYPKDWVERGSNMLRGELFRVTTPRSPGRPTLGVFVHIYPLPLDKLADFLMMVLRTSATDVTVVRDKPSQLRDGSQAREVEITMVMNAVPRSEMVLATKKGDWWIQIGMGSHKGEIGEDLKAILYSLQFEPGKDEPVKVPPDVQEFFDRHNNDWISHDLTKFMTHYSDRYLNSGVRKGEMERYFRQFIGLVTSSEVSITEFVPEGDKAYLAGFVSGNLGRIPLQETSIIKESGEWKWYGNQRDVSP